MKKLLIFAVALTHSVGCATTAFTPNSSNVLGGMRSRLRMRRVNDALTRSASLRAGIHSLMQAARISDGIFRAHRTVGSFESDYHRDQVVRLLKDFSFKMSHELGVPLAQWFVLSALDKTPVLSEPVLHTIIVSDTQRTAQILSDLLKDKEGRMVVYEQTRALRDIVLDNWSDAARNAYITQYGPELIATRYVHHSDYEPKVTYGWQGWQVYGASLLSLLAGAYLSHRFAHRQSR